MNNRIPQIEIENETIPVKLRQNEMIDGKKKSSLCETPPWILTMGLSILAVAVALITIYVLVRERKNLNRDFMVAVQDELFRLLFSGVTTVGILVWPLIWEKVIGLDMLGKVPSLWLAFLWPLVMSFNDIVYAHRRRPNKETSTSFRSGHKSSDGSILITVALAIGGLIAADGSSKLMSSSKTLLTYALMLLIAFVLPIPPADNPSPSSIIIGASQRVAFNYASSLLIAGIAINFVHVGADEVRKSINEICK